VVQRFVKVMPRDYARALAEQEKLQAELEAEQTAA
jgi:glutamate synthase domain-containing protein 3